MKTELVAAVLLTSCIGCATSSSSGTSANGSTRYTRSQAAAAAIDLTSCNMGASSESDPYLEVYKREKCEQEYDEKIARIRQVEAANLVQAQREQAVRAQEEQRYAAIRANPKSPELGATRRETEVICVNQDGRLASRPSGMLVCMVSGASVFGAVLENGSVSVVGTRYEGADPVDLRRRFENTYGAPQHVSVTEDDFRNWRWSLEGGEVAVTGYDGGADVVIRRVSSSEPTTQAIDYGAIFTAIELLLDATGSDFAEHCDGEPKHWPGKGEFAGWRFYSCSYHIAGAAIGPATVLLNVGPDGLAKASGFMFLMEHFDNVMDAAIASVGRSADEVGEDVSLWHLPKVTLKLRAAPNTGWGLVQLERTGVRL